MIRYPLTATTKKSAPQRQLVALSTPTFSTERESSVKNGASAL